MIFENNARYELTCKGGETFAKIKLQYYDKITKSITKNYNNNNNKLKKTNNRKIIAHGM